ncbi:hypothetical protein D6827_02370 [Candidatus Parcubacteria bacterium]|nr:MAG: hypothetical protein D6827_02370 [Candidatus Parcubacteria bacterium]
MSNAIIKIKKSSGEIVNFDIHKVERSIRRAGITGSQVKFISKQVANQVREGMTTKEIYRIVKNELKKVNVGSVYRYDLKNALLRLGPAGYKFEKYVASILKAYRYDAYNPEYDLQGACVGHEVDVIAERDGRRIFIEAKFRNDFFDFVNLKDTMATWTRFLDLVDGASLGKCEHFDECWIITNARFSDRAEKLGVCKGIHLVGWNFPKEASFGHMVDNALLYPLTIINDLTDNELDILASKDIMLCKEVLEYEAVDLAEILGADLQRAEWLIETAKKITTKTPA